jgi:hypothetical protein
MFPRLLIPCLSHRTLSLSIPYDTVMPRRHSVKHNRCYSWPPSLHLIDVSNIQIPLPDINDDPWAHFMDQASEESDDTDEFLANAGIIPPESKVMLAEKATEFRDTISKRWKSFHAKYIRRSCRSSKQKDTVVSSDSELAEKVVSSLPFKFLDATEISSNERPAISPLQPTTPAPSFGVRPVTELTPRQVQLIYRTANGHYRPRRHTPADRIERRSWSSPPVWLYTIKEQPDEDDEDISDT